MCAIYLLAHRPALMVLAIVVLTVGATLTVSKIFFFVGIPVVGWHFVRLSTRRDRRFMIGLSCALCAWLAWVAGLLPAWAGSEQITRQLPNDHTSILSALTAGRYGSGSTLQPVIESLRHDQPLIGYGLPGLHVAYDSAWVEALVLAGVLGVLAMAGISALLWRSQRRCRSLVAEPERRLFSALLAILLGSSVGLPVLTSNRISVVVWMLLALLISASVGASASPSRTAAGPADPVRLPVGPWDLPPLPVARLPHQGTEI